MSKFSAVIYRTDRLSPFAPTGSRGHRLFISKEVTLKYLPQLIGKAITITPELNAHANPTGTECVKGVIGYITKTWVDNDLACISGDLLIHPEHLIISAASEVLGCSFEANEVEIKDKREFHWEIIKLRFTGVAILKQSRAAFRTDSFFAPYD